MKTPTVLFVLLALLLAPVAAAQDLSDRLERLGEERLQDRLEERAVRRAMIRAQERSRRLAELAAERAQKKAAIISEKQALMAADKAARAREMIKKHKLSKTDSEKRLQLARALRQDFAITRIADRGRELYIRSGEILSLDTSSRGRKAAKVAGLERIRREKLGKLGMKIDAWRVPAGADIKEILGKVRKADPAGTWDFNQIYQDSGAGALLDTVQVPAPSGVETFTVGVIDTGVDSANQALSGATVLQKNFGRGAAVTPREHGTAVASILASHGRAEIMVADVFSGDSGVGDAEALVKALEWMAASDIGVINVSLAGPDNQMLRRAVKVLARRGHVLVAAVGNDGLDNAARYPASYDGVIGVTAVDRDLQVYDMANRGQLVDIAAPGVGVKTASDGIYTGTSFAAPFVSARLAPALSVADPLLAKIAWRETSAGARDLGEAGPDEIFGVGMIGQDFFQEKRNKPAAPVVSPVFKRENDTGD